MTAVATLPVHYARSGRIGRVVLCHPPVNVLTLEALYALEQALAEAGGDRELTVLCLQGEGKAFCAGVAVADHVAGRFEETLLVFGRIIRRLLTFHRPVVAAIHGATLGGGCELALACDIVVARDDLKLGQPEIALGVFPPAAAALLPRLVGRQLAMDLILTGRSLTAAEALQMGLVRSVSPLEAFAAERDAVLERLARLSGPALEAARRAVNEGCEGSLDGALARTEAVYRWDLMRLPDAHEGIAAFLERRPPAWRAP